MLEKWSDLSPEEVDVRKKSLQKAAGYIMKRFKEIDCYVGESLNPDGAMGFLEHRDIDNKEVPVMMFFKDGIIAEKCVSIRVTNRAKTERWGPCFKN